MLDRREFTRLSLLGMLSGVAITISGCGGGSGGPGSPSTPTDGKAGTISVNHGHTAVISSAQLAAGGQLSLGIRGNSDHPHTVDLSAAEIVSIRDGNRVSKVSSDDQFHTHTVTFN